MIETLSLLDAVVPAFVGMRRQLYAMSQRIPNHGGTEDGLSFDHHILGAMAEFVVARVLNMFWEPNVGVLTGIDVGKRVAVRMRRIPGTGSDLAFRAKDKEIPHVLVHNRGTLQFELKGWLYPEEGKVRGTFNETSQVWYVPPPYRSIEELIAMLQRPETVMGEVTVDA